MFTVVDCTSVAQCVLVPLSMLVAFHSDTGTFSQVEYPSCVSSSCASLPPCCKLNILHRSTSCTVSHCVFVSQIVCVMMSMARWCCLALWQVGTWGQVLFPLPWREFRMWYDLCRHNKSRQPIVEGLKSTDWFLKRVSLLTLRLLMCVAARLSVKESGCCLERIRPLIWRLPMLVTVP